MFKNNLRKILEAYHNEYKKLFEIFDFSADRFTEENQTVNFCRAVQSVYEDAVVWYEYPWKNDVVKNERQSSSRFDAVIYLPNETLVVVEAKCLRHKDKYLAMKGDLERIISHHENVVLRDYTIKTVYAVILADFWNSKKSTAQFHDLQKYWNASPNKDKLVQDEGKMFSQFAEVAGELSNPQWNYKECSIESKKKYYYLLSMIGKVKQ